LIRPEPIYIFSCRLHCLFLSLHGGGRRSPDKYSTARPGSPEFQPTREKSIMDTTAAVTALGDIGTAVAAVGGALVLAAAIAVGWKWVKGAIFG